jgi:hypothetical protein
MSANNTPAQQGTDGYVISYLTLRRAIGILGFFLPIVLLFFYYLLNRHRDYPPSISHYYYTNMGTYFTGTLCAVALFMFAYNGPSKKDKIAAMICCLTALGVAFFPVDTYIHQTNIIQQPIVFPRVYLTDDPIRNTMHFSFATILFSTLAYFCLFLFTKSSDPCPTPEKLIRNKVYRICGWLILICIISIALSNIKWIYDHVFYNFTNSTFVLETIALFAFGISWLVKGEVVLKDKVANQLQEDNSNIE